MIFTFELKIKFKCFTHFSKRFQILIWQSKCLSFLANYSSDKLSRLFFFLDFDPCTLKIISVSKTYGRLGIYNIHMLRVLYIQMLQTVISLSFCVINRVTYSSLSGTVIAKHHSQSTVRWNKSLAV